MMVGTGGMTIANIKRGEKNNELANRYFTLTNLILLSFGITSIITGLLSLDSLISLLKAEATTKAFLNDYLRVLFPFFPAFMITFSLDMFVRSDGKPGFAVITVTIGSVLNVLLDYIFIAHLNLGIKGAAWATGIAQIIPSLIFIIYILRFSKWQFTTPFVPLAKVAKMLYNGLSEMVNELSLGIAIFFFNIIILSRIGSLGIAAFSIAQYTSTIALAVFLGTAQAIHPGISFNLGASKIKRVVSLRNLGIKVNLVFGLLVFAVLVIFRSQLAGFFSKENKELLVLSSKIIYYYSYAFILMGINICISMFFTAINSPARSATISLSRSLIGILIGLAFLPPLLGDLGIWLAIGFAELLTFIISIIFLKKSDKKGIYK
jgi:putative MATE family efflux protein